MTFYHSGTIRTFQAAPNWNRSTRAWGKQAQRRLFKQAPLPFHTIPNASEFVLCTSTSGQLDGETTERAEEKQENKLGGIRQQADAFPNCAAGSAFVIVSVTLENTNDRWPIWALRSALGCLQPPHPTAPHPTPIIIKEKG